MTGSPLRYSPGRARRRPAGPPRPRRRLPGADLLQRRLRVRRGPGAGVRPGPGRVRPPAQDGGGPPTLGASPSAAPRHRRMASRPADRLGRRARGVPGWRVGRPSPVGRLAAVAGRGGRRPAGRARLRRLPAGHVPLPGRPLRPRPGLRRHRRPGRHRRRHRGPGRPGPPSPAVAPGLDHGGHGGGAGGRRRHRRPAAVGVHPGLLAPHRGPLLRPGQQRLRRPGRHHPPRSPPSTWSTPPAAGRPW